RSTDCAREVTVGGGATRGDPAQRAPHLALEGRSAGIDPDGGQRLEIAGEVALETTCCSRRIRRLAEFHLPEALLEHRPPPRPPLREVERAEAPVANRQCDPADR